MAPLSTSMYHQSKTKYCTPKTEKKLKLPIFTTHSNSEFPDDTCGKTSV